MLKHVAAHRSNSSLGGGVSNSCLSSLPPCGPSSLTCMSSTISSLPPIRRSSLSVYESRTRSSVPSSAEMRPRGSLSSSEIRPRLVYRRMELYKQPFSSLQIFKGPQERLKISEQDNENIAEKPSSESKTEPEVTKSKNERKKRKEEQEKEAEKASDENIYDPEVTHQRFSRSYTPVYPTRFGHNRDAYYDYLRSQVITSEKMEEEKLLVSNNIVEVANESDKSFVDKINEQDSYPSSTIHFDDENYPPSSGYCQQGTILTTSAISCVQEEKFPLEKTEITSVTDRESSKCGQKFNISSANKSRLNCNYNYGKTPVQQSDNERHAQQKDNLKASQSSLHPLNTSFDGSVCSLPYHIPKDSSLSPGALSKSLLLHPNCIHPNSILPRSSTLPRKIFTDELRRDSIRSNSSTTSLLSSVSCASLANHSRDFNSRTSSITSLSETIPVKVYLRKLRPDMEYKTVSMTSHTSCRELIMSLLARFRLRHRDPNLFFILMEVTVRSPSDDAPVKRLLVLDDNARPAELQQCRPKGEARFSVGVRRGGLVRVHDSILMPGSQYKSLMVACNTNVDELVLLMLKCYNSTENPLNYALHELCKNPYSDRQIASDECPLMVQADWPRNNRANWAFVLRRNLTYAFSLKSRMSWRRSLDQSSTDTESEFDDHTNSSVVSYSNQQSRSSSISSTSSVSSACSSSSSENSLDSGYLGSPLSGCKVPTNTSTYGKLLKIDSRQVRIGKPTSKLTIPITPNVSKLSMNSTLPSVSSGTTAQLSKSTPTAPVPNLSTTFGAKQKNVSTSARSAQFSLLPKKHLRPVVPPPSLKMSLPSASVKPISPLVPRLSSRLASTVPSSVATGCSTSSGVQPFRVIPSSLTSFQLYRRQSRAHVSNEAVSSKSASSLSQQLKSQQPIPVLQSRSESSTECSSSTSPPITAELKLLDAIESLKSINRVQKKT